MLAQYGDEHQTPLKLKAITLISKVIVLFPILPAEIEPEQYKCVPVHILRGCIICSYNYKHSLKRWTFLLTVSSASVRCSDVLLSNGRSQSESDSASCQRWFESANKSEAWDVLPPLNLLMFLQPLF